MSPTWQLIVATLINREIWIVANKFNRDLGLSVEGTSFAFGFQGLVRSKRLDTRTMRNPVAEAMHLILLLSIVALFLGSLLSLTSHPHWFFRAWDFPRVQIVVITIVIALIHFVVAHWIIPASTGISWAIGVLAVSLVLWHTLRIIPYTPIAATQAKGTTEVDRESPNLVDSRLRIVVSNLELENDQYAEWLQTIQTANPDVLIALEPNKRWVKEAESLLADYPHQIINPQDNWYGMMLLSRLPIESHRVRYLVQNDVPSIDAAVRMNDGQVVRIVGVHPRPPEPIRDNDATARDAELILWGRELEKERGPVIIGGDLNDVAWSKTTRLFLRTSGLLDPRRGRGFFNTFHADHWWLRFPLDHIFHSTHFTVSGIERLPYVGSDHFPMLIDLQLEPAKRDEHEVLEQKEGDEEDAELRIERAKEAKDLNAEPVAKALAHESQ